MFKPFAPMHLALSPMLLALAMIADPASGYAREAVFAKSTQALDFTLKPAKALPQAGKFGPHSSKRRGPASLGVTFIDSRTLLPEQSTQFHPASNSQMGLSLKIPVKR